MRNGWVKRVYLWEVLQRFAGVNELLFTLIAANLLSFLSDIGGHLLDDSDTLRLDLLEALHQLKRTLDILPSHTVNSVRQRVCEL